MRLRMLQTPAWTEARLLLPGPMTVAFTLALPLLFLLVLGGVFGNRPGAKVCGGHGPLGLGLFFVMMMLSGAGPPFEVMTDVMRHVSDILPLTYVTRSCRHRGWGRGSPGVTWPGRARSPWQRRSPRGLRSAGDNRPCWWHEALARVQASGHLRG